MRPLASISVLLLVFIARAARAPSTPTPKECDLFRPAHFQYNTLVKPADSKDSCLKWSRWADFVDPDYNPVTPSLFPSLLPPYLNFAVVNHPSPLLLDLGLRWVRTIPLVNHLVSRMGLQLVPPPKLHDQSVVEWTGFFSANVGLKNRKPKHVIRREGQKYNLIPGGEQLCHKDKMLANIQKFTEKHGNAIPCLLESFHWPRDVFQLHRRLLQQNGRTDTQWIFKAAKASHSWGQFTFGTATEFWSPVHKRARRHRAVIQRFLGPREQLLIEGRIVRLRAFVLVTSVHPLRIYLYRHLEPLLECHASQGVGECVGIRGVVLPMDVFWKNLRRQLPDIEPSAIWDELKDLVVKLMLSVEGKLAALYEAELKNRYNAYQLWSVDTLLDKRGALYLLEVNRYASMEIDYTNEAQLRIPLLVETFNVVGYHFPEGAAQKLRSIVRIRGPLTFRRSLYAFPAQNRLKQRKLRKVKVSESNYEEEILKSVTLDELQLLAVAEDELSRTRNYERIFPTNSTAKYLKFVESDLHFYWLQQAWEARFGQASDRTAAIQELTNRITN